MSLLLTVLVVLMIVASVIALETRERLSAIVALGAVGFLLAVAFLLLGAPDVALTQIAVEIVSLLLLLRLTGGAGAEDALADPEGAEPPGVGTLAVGLTAALVVAGAGVAAFAAYPALGEPVMARAGDAPSLFYLERGLEETGSANIVTAVLLDFRAYDTLGEATVLFGAVIGALTVLRRRAATAPAEEVP